MLTKVYPTLRRLQSHIVLKKWLDWWQRKNGALKPDDLHEFHLFVNRLLFHGEAKFSVELFEHLWASRRRARFMGMLKECPYIVIVKPPCWREGHKRCTTYALHGLPGLIKAREPEDESVDAPVQTAIPYWRVSRAYSYIHVVPGLWFSDRADSWRDLCISRNYGLTYDHIGDTHFGAPTFHACDALLLPSHVDWSTFAGSEASLAWSKRMLCRLSAGYVRVCHRVMGRLYHPLVNLSKFLRRLLRFKHQGRAERVAEVDLSNTYWCLLARMMPDCEEKHRLIRCLQTGDIYMLVNRACAAPYATRNEVKAEFQKQCLFWKVWRHMEEKSRPLWFALRREFPVLAGMIDQMRREKNGSQLSEVLMRDESSFFIDRMLPLIHSMGIPVLTVHDSVVVPESERLAVWESLRSEGLKFFGFVPRFNITCQPDSNERECDRERGSEGSSVELVFA